MLFHPLVSKIWARTDQNGRFFDNNWPPSWMCHSDRTCCWTWYTPNQTKAILSIPMQSCYMPERFKRVLVGWHLAKVRGRLELKIEETQCGPGYKYNRGRRIYLINFTCAQIPTNYTYISWPYLHKRACIAIDITIVSLLNRVQSLELLLETTCLHRLLWHGITRTSPNRPLTAYTI